MNESDVDAAMQHYRKMTVYGVALTEEESHRLWRRLRTEVVFEDSPDRIARLEAERAELEGFARRCQLVHQSARDDYEDMLAAKDARIAALEAENAALNKALAMSVRLHNAAFMAFIADPPDLPEPLRRPDGTLMPQPKALTLPRETGDKRRIGG